MKITQITYTGFGGLGSVVFSLIGADQAREHHWSVGFIGDQPIDETYPVRCQEHGVSYAAFRSTSGRPYRAWLELSRWLDESRPDAIICHSINSILACRWHAWKRRIPLLAVEHTPNQVKTRNEWVFSRMSMLLADRVVVLTEAYREELRRTHGRLFRENKVALIPNSIDTSVFYPTGAPRGERASRLKIGMAARFSFSKRQDLLVAVLERLAVLRPALDVQLRFAGDGSETQRVHALAQVSPVGPRIRFDGLLSEEAIAPWLRELDIYVHATEGETLSTSLLQAMATGLPIVASDIAGVSNLLGQQGEYGCCVDNEIEAFAHAILLLVDDPARVVALGQRVRARILDRYNQAAMLDSYLDVIEACR
jgi:glycosyltransferase involved in cell wall biosynthesis